MTKRDRIDDGEQDRRSGIQRAYVHTFTCRHNALDHRGIVIQIVAYSATIPKRQCIRVQAYRPGVTVREITITSNGILLRTNKSIEDTKAKKRKVKLNVM